MPSDPESEAESPWGDRIRYGLWGGLGLSIVGMMTGLASPGFLGLFSILVLGERAVNAVQSLGLRGHFVRELAAARRVVAKGQFEDGVTQLKLLAASGDYHGSSIAQYHAALARYLQGELSETIAELETLERMPGVLAISESRALGAYLFAEVALLWHRDRAEAAHWLVEAERRALAAVRARPPCLVPALLAVEAQDRAAFDVAVARLDRDELGEARVRLLDVLTAYFVDPSTRDGELLALLGRARIKDPNPLVELARRSLPELEAFLAMQAS